MARKVIGVDFGSSQSSIAIMEIGSAGKPELLNVGGGRNGVTIPTLLALDPNDDTVLDFGTNVRTHYKQENTAKFASNFKRYLGSQSADASNDEQKNSNKHCKLFIKVLAEYVRKHYNVDKLDQDDYATCFAYPATWSEEQIKLLKEYAEEAGFPDIHAIPEPVAAMHALKIQDNFRFGNKKEDYMVIDFGGGTLDICIIETDILGRTPQILSTSGDPTLGGKEFDGRIEHLFFRNNENIKKSDLSPHEIAELGEKFKEAKEAFSDNFLFNEVVTQAFHIERGQYSLTTSKQEFNNLCQDLGIYEKIKKAIRDALQKANKAETDIQKVILTGGSSKWFFLKKIIADEFSLVGDKVFLTTNPYTDVANGCAVAVGRPDAPPEKEGIWVRYQLDDEPCSEAKCILPPGRSSSSEREMMYIGKICGTRYVKPYKITLSWWTGLEEGKLESAGNVAIIEFYARTNFPVFGRIKSGINGFRGMDVIQTPDEYFIYLQYSEDASGTVKYVFKIVDSDAATKEKADLKGKPTDGLPSGYCETGAILPGYISSRSTLGIKTRKLTPLN